MAHVNCSSHVLSGLTAWGDLLQCYHPERSVPVFLSYMKLHLNLSLRRALLAALAAAATFSSSATAGLVDARYDLQYYLDFAYNMGMFRPGASNLTVAYKDGTTVSEPVIPVMPNLDSFGAKGDGVTDDTEAIRAAMNCGKPTVFFNAGRYLIDDVIEIPPHVHRVNFMYGDLASGPNLSKMHPCRAF